MSDFRKIEDIDWKCGEPETISISDLARRLAA